MLSAMAKELRLPSRSSTPRETQPDREQLLPRLNHIYHYTHKHTITAPPIQLSAAAGPAQKYAELDAQLKAMKQSMEAREKENLASEMPRQQKIFQAEVAGPSVSPCNKIVLLVIDAVVYSLPH